MNELIKSLAIDFSVEFANRFGQRNPADEYFDPLTKVLGLSPSQADVIKVCRDRIPQLRLELSKWLELELDDQTARDVLRQAIINYYGDTCNI